MNSGSPVQAEFYTTYEPGSSPQKVVDFYACDEDNAPKTYSGPDEKQIRKVCTLTADLSVVPHYLFERRTTPSGKSYGYLSYDIGIELESGGLRFDLRKNELVYGLIKADFE